MVYLYSLSRCPKRANWLCPLLARRIVVLWQTDYRGTRKVTAPIQHIVLGERADNGMDNIATKLAILAIDRLTQWAFCLTPPWPDV
jgi:hypothetical protein